MRNGFALIELLVVISIIGLLAAIIAANAQRARERAHDAVIEESLSQIRTQAVFFYEAHADTYETQHNLQSCPSFDAGNDYLFEKKEILDLIAAVRELLEAGSDVSCAALGPAGERADSFAVGAPLRSDTSKVWCVDGSGFSGIATIETELNGTPTAYCKSPAGSGTGAGSP